MEIVMEKEKKEVERLNVGKITLDVLHKKANQIQSKCQDYVVPNVSLTNMWFNSNNGHLNFLCEGKKRELGMSRWAMGQLCNKIGVPAQYVEKCIRSGQIDLAGTNVNTWLESYEKNLFLRRYKDRIRGILSDRYMTLDTPDIIDVLGNVVDQNNYHVCGNFLTPERFHVRIVNKDQMTKKDDLFAGIQVDSSDVGRSTLSVTFFIYKLVCTNGLILAQKGGTLFSQKHLGNNKDVFKKGFVEAMQKLPELQSKYGLIVRMANEVKVEASPEHMEREIKQFTGLSDEAVKKVFEIRKERYPETHLGIINAVTDLAKEYTLEKRIELERAAGDMLLNMRVA